MPDELLSQIRDARERTLCLIQGLDAHQMMGPHLDIVNPLRWEIGHTAYFYEYWVLRQHLGEQPVFPGVDELYDSITIAHDDRWDLPLPELADTLAYMHEVQTRVCRHIEQDGLDRRRDYLAQYAVFHEDMHTEAFTYTRQTLGYPAPAIQVDRRPEGASDDGTPDVAIPGGTFVLGATPQDGFVFDNEKWGHEQEVVPFRIAREAVSQAEFAAFADAGGYLDRALWSGEGWDWRQGRGLEHPVYWRRGEDGWQRRQFDQWWPLQPQAAMIHVSWHEAEAFCRWAGRRLPTELEWEVAAAAEPAEAGGGLSRVKRRYPWGDEQPTPSLANLDGHALGTVDVGALSAGDSAFGCRQMIGNVWEWTDTLFGPYPGFEPDMYADYSQPLFGNTRVLRGGGWATRGRMIRNTWRNYYGADRNDVFAGFRTCAL
jgi:iron(II)-dependent oxidoreductase